MIFINKLWNASRFVSMKIEDFAKNDINKIEETLEKNYDNLMLHEKWILSRIKYLSDEVSA
jgi:valyl-tRNA synthetase